MEKEILYDIGLTKGEVEVYLALLKTGFSSTGNIVKESKVTKSKVYDILNRLKEKGLVSISLKNDINYYDAAPPNFLIELIEKRQKEVKNQKEQIEKLIPDLVTIQTSALKKERIEIFEGFKGMKSAFQILEKEFEPGQEFLVFGVDKTLNQQQLNFFINYHKIKLKSRIKTKVIFTSNLKGVKEYHLKKSRYNEEKHLEQSSAIPINIYKDMVIIPLLSQGEKEITIFFKNKKLAEGFRKYFYTLWKVAKA
ncbi:hypothetical protein GF386_01695 [Candidatus Pacearchaeota archaeon]|nr:hypothetical protein [Candidatus Pacearchaeota archaeon]